MHRLVQMTTPTECKPNNTTTNNVKLITKKQVFLDALAGDRTSHLIKFSGERCGRGGRVLIFNTLPSWRVLKKR